MNKKIHCYLTAILMMLSIGGTAQGQKSDNIKPRWLHSTIEPSNSSFVYEVVPSSATTLSSARDGALSTLIVEAGLEGGQTAETNVQSYNSEEHIGTNGHMDRRSEEIIKVRTTLKGKPVTLTAKKIDEYWVRGNDGVYHLMTLFARSQVDKTPVFDKVRLTTNYGVHGLWRSAIVPGWGQLYKGSTLKGGLIMGGTIACIGGIILTDCTRASYNSKINKTHDLNLKKIYADRRTNFATGRNICIGALCALYIYNLVDAIVAPGARRVLTSPTGAKGYAYSWSPAVTEDFGVGINATFTF